MIQGEGQAGGAIGLWLNKRSVSRFEIPVAHQLSAQPAGWRLDVLEPGKLSFVVEHERVPVDFEPGDYILASGDDLYVSLQQRRDKRGDKEKGDEEQGAGDRSRRPLTHVAGKGE